MTDLLRRWLTSKQILRQSSTMFMLATVCKPILKTLINTVLYFCLHVIGTSRAPIELMFFLGRFDR